MNAASRDERFWRSYLRAITFMLPAIIAWGFACTFLAPKVQEICRDSGIQVEQFPWLLPVTWFLVRHGLALFVIVGLMLIVSEFASRGRGPGRRAILGVAVWLINVAVFCGLNLLLTVTLIAVPSLMLK